MSELSTALDLARTLVEKHYPEAGGAILTGSQTEPYSVTKQSDIDIVLFSDDFTNLSTHIFRDGKHKIDFTKIGMADLPRLLVDYSYDQRGVILHMIMNGVIVKDDYGFLLLIKNKCKALFDLGNASIENELKVLRNNLAKLKKNLLKDLDERYVFFLLIEFAHIITSAHLLTSEGWFTSNSYRRTRYLLANEDNVRFMNSLMSVIKGAIPQKEITQENRKKIINIIDRYLEHPFTKKTTSYRYNRFIVNLKFRTESIRFMSSEVIPKILGDEYLSQLYKYTTTHSYINVFKYGIVIVFDSRHEAFNEDSVLTALYKIFQKQRKPIEKLKIVSQEYLLRQFNDAELYPAFEKVLIDIGLYVAESVRKDGKLNKNKFMLIAHALLIEMAKSMKLEPATFTHLMDYLCKKWRYGSGKLSNLNYEQSLSYNRKVEKRAETYFTTNQSILESVVSTAWDDIGKLNVEPWDFLELSLKLRDFQVAIEKSGVQIDKYILSILKYYLRTDLNPAIPYFYTLGAELVLNCLYIDKADHYTIAYTLGRLYKEKQIPATIN